MAFNAVQVGVAVANLYMKTDWCSELNVPAMLHFQGSVLTTLRSHVVVCMLDPRLQISRCLYKECMVVNCVQLTSL